jgi:hypothetical protein
MKTTRLFPWIVGSVAIGAACTAQAQRVQEVESARTREQMQKPMKETQKSVDNVPEFFPGESSDVGPQSVLKFKPKRHWVDFLADCQYYGTSNPLMVENNPEGTTLLVSTAQIAFAPDPIKTEKGKLYPRIGYKHQWFNYNLGSEPSLPIYEELDFDVDNAFADCNYSFGDNWNISFGLDWLRLLSHHSYEANYAESYKEWVPRWDVNKAFPISDRALFSLGYQGAYHLTETDPIPTTDALNRWDTAFMASFTYAMTPKLVLQPYYRFQWSEYMNWPNRRSDLLHSFGFMTGYFFTDKLSARVFITYDKRNTTEPILPDYENYNIGIGLNFTYRF